MKKWLGWITIGLLALGLGACEKGPAPTATAEPDIRVSPTVTNLPVSTQTALLTPTINGPLPTNAPVPATASPAEGQAQGALTSRATSTPNQSPTPLPPTEPLPEYYDYPSPDGKYFVRCSDYAYLRLYRTADSHLIWELSSKDVSCYAIVWARRESVVAFPVSVGNTTSYYVWREEEPTPKVVAQTASGGWPFWSPQSDRFVVFDLFWHEEGHYEAGRLTLIVAYADGRPLLRTEADFPSNDSGESVYWINDDVFWIGHSAGICCSDYLYFDANTGKEIPGWFNSFELSQPPSCSPDLHWQVTDSSYRVWEGDLYASPQHYSHGYEIVNFQTARNYSLVYGAHQYMQFVGWSDNSKVFYLVSRPVTAASVSDPKVPFGFLALDPATQNFTPLVEQAVFANLSPNKHLAWVAFPARRKDGTLGLDGGIFDLVSGTLTGRTFVSDAIIYANPTDGDLVPVLWSADNMRVVFGDSRGTLTLLNADGTAQTLATDLFVTTAWPYDAHYSWSPDDQHLLVQSGSRTWVVTMP